MDQALDSETMDKVLKKLEKEMRDAAKDLAFERAAELRDAIVAFKGKKSREADE